MEIKIKYLNENALTPKQATIGSSGYDLYSIEEVILKSGEIKLVKTGISIEIPLGFEAQIRPRSGLALKKNITVLNTPGTIDSDYRGELGVILINHGKTDVVLEKHERIAQMVFQKVEFAEFIEENLTQTERNSGGFGSSGNK